MQVFFEAAVFSTCASVVLTFTHRKLLSTDFCGENEGESRRRCVLFVCLELLMSVSQRGPWDGRT